MGTLHFGFHVVNDCEKTTFVNSLIVWKPNIQGRHRRRRIPNPAAGRIGELAGKARLASRIATTTMSTVYLHGDGKNGLYMRLRVGI